MQHDINEQEMSLNNTAENNVDIKLARRQEKLRNEMEFFEKDFNNLKNEFNKYLSTTL